jgi:hypothetical protein
MLWRDMRGRTKEIHKELQDLDSMGSPHKEEKVIGGNIDVDLLSLFPQKYARIMGGMEEKGQACKVNNGGERSPKTCLAQGGRRGIYTPTKYGRCRTWRGRLSGQSMAGLSGQPDNPAPWPEYPAPYLGDADQSP